MRKVWSRVKRSPRGPVTTLCELAGAAAAVHGVAMVSTPAAWITGGVVLAAIGVRQA